MFIFMFIMLAVRLDPSLQGCIYSKYKQLSPPAHAKQQNTAHLIIYKLGMVGA